MCRLDSSTTYLGQRRITSIDNHPSNLNHLGTILGHINPMLIAGGGNVDDAVLVEIVSRKRSRAILGRGRLQVPRVGGVGSLRGSGGRSSGLAGGGSGSRSSSLVGNAGPGIRLGLCGCGHCLFAMNIPSRAVLPMIPERPNAARMWWMGRSDGVGRPDCTRDDGGEWSGVELEL